MRPPVQVRSAVLYAKPRTIQEADSTRRRTGPLDQLPLVDVAGDHRMSPKALAELVAPDWAVALEPVAGNIAAMGDFLRAEIAAGRRYLPQE